MSTDAKILSVIGIVTTLVLAGGVFLLNRSITTPTATITTDSPNLIRNDSYQTATGSAKVNLVEFGDYQCPACASAHQVVKSVMTLDVNFVFRHFPLPLHKNAVIASLAAEAAGVQGKYWEMHNFLYEDQANWSESSNPKEVFLGYAGKIQLDIDKFSQDIESPQLKSKIERDRLDGISLGINATPTFFINGEKLAGMPNFTQFKNMIQEKSR
ncbi:hypothetical protein A3H85_01945 [Candidatus Daviesbacteria bacterium RIFCSPLOWO2_02_FULL_40_8]|uniref:Thioredoxin domain-containing protein n=1 Tax=Candidatus Daviesbacteria bacterium RIFCSPLOWO2_01_FULL_40_24 TaxID=1797787 RepID=A0A1F5MJK0_9BACT|nr:MAG: hypothetical protein A2780_02620 [Candidatus Daviesbacteria bacterium RIFCSPHIGHO2_01_FULL_41_45]OGE35433.1 MAG: hypothetical protein A3C32_03195 [Candidatus Daviesbacteria bacterium RIFCSPHIGHO2_02_FULL_41_14]OGE65523.1 MAG: hypothetical protein A3B49_01775 [Candidatus Daviesbacteria bacterium RIFCSPLOWO2_01_FULL_40_24]OGE67019.1 MAG: hypothetical protein A3H85_01945 [Candidatus Daviesbacteria bacterium RIFCSPLOWO2_02_FULL_40_8]